MFRGLLLSKILFICVSIIAKYTVKMATSNSNWQSVEKNKIHLNSEILNIRFLFICVCSEACSLIKFYQYASLLVVNTLLKWQAAGKSSKKKG